MSRTLAYTALGFVPGLVLIVPLGTVASPAPSRAVVPLHFEPAAPGLGPDVVAVHRVPGLTLLISLDSATLALRSEAGTERVRLAFASASRASVRFEDPRSGVSHYFLGSDPSRFRTNVPRYGRVRLAEVWPGIDIVFHGDAGRLEYDLVVRAGADLSSVALTVEGASGLSISPGGDLVLGLSCGDLVQGAPSVYQELGGVRQAVPGRFVLRPEGYGFEAEAADPSAPIVVDPYLSWVSMAGGSDADRVSGLAAGTCDDVYVAGKTSSLDFPVTAPYQPTLGGLTDVVVMKLDPSGNAVWSTYLGGTGDDDALGLTLDAAGNVWIAGSTTSPTFPIVGGFQTAIRSAQDAFVAVLAPDGASVVYSTFLGGSGPDAANAIAIRPTGGASVAGETESPDFPTKDAWQGSPGGGKDAFVAAVSLSSGLSFSSYLGGSEWDSALGVSVDSSGWTYVGGGTASREFPSLRPAGPAYVAKEDGFVAAFSPAGALMSSSTFGGSGTDYVRAVATGPSGSVFAVGFTRSDDFPIALAFQWQKRGDGDAFVLKLSPQASALEWSSYLGGGGTDSARAVAVGSDEGVLVAGSSSDNSSTPWPFPAVAPLQTVATGAPSAFVSRFESNASLTFSSVLGGDGGDAALAVAPATSGGILVAGETESTGLLGWQTSPADGYVARIAYGGLADLGLVISGPAVLTSRERATYGVTITNSGLMPVSARVRGSAELIGVGSFGSLSTSQAGWHCFSGACENLMLPPGSSSLDLTFDAPLTCPTSAPITVRASVSSPATTDPDPGNNIEARTVTVNPPAPGTAVISGHATVPCNGGTAQLQIALTSGSPPAQVYVRASSGDAFYVYLQLEPSVSFPVTVYQDTTYTIEAVHVGGCAAEPGGGSGQAVVEVAPDEGVPVVTAPPGVYVRQTLCLGHLPAVHLGGVNLGYPSAVDACDLSLENLPPLLDGQSSYGAVVEAGEHTVTYRYRDDAGNVGSASQALTVIPIGDLERDGDVDVLDVVILAAFIVGNASPGSAPFLSDRLTADANDDSNVDVFDLIQLQAHVVGNVGCLRP